jgi:hypothetical protein
MLRMPPRFRERLITPAPPSVLATYVQQKLRYWMTFGIEKINGAADALVCGFPCAEVVVDMRQRPELLLE